MRGCRVRLATQRMSVGIFQRFCLLASFCVSLMIFSGCGMSNKPINWKPEFNIFPASTQNTSAKKAIIERSAEAGAVSISSPSFQVT